MKKVIIVFLSIISFTSCKYFRGDHCNNTLPVVGVYENMYDKSAKNILILKENGTFEQIFTKGKNVKKNSGTWKFFKEFCDIDFKGLELMHELSESNKQLFKQGGIHRLNNIVFIEGLGYEFDFYRVED